MIWESAMEFTPLIPLLLITSKASTYGKLALSLWSRIQWKSNPPPHSKNLITHHREPLIEDFVLELGRNSSIIDALQKANIDALSKIGNRTSHAKSKCYWSMNLHASPVSSDFNEKYACMSFFYIFILIFN